MSPSEHPRAEGLVRVAQASEGAGQGLVGTTRAWGVQTSQGASGMGAGRGSWRGGASD